MTWPTEDAGDTAHHATPPRSQTRDRERVPMEEREARANRFVSHLVGDTDSDRHSPPSSKEPLSPTTPEEEEELEYLLAMLPEDSHLREHLLESLGHPLSQEQQ